MIGRAWTIVSSSSIHATERASSQHFAMSQENLIHGLFLKLNVYLMQLRAPSLIV